MNTKLTGLLAVLFFLSGYAAPVHAASLTDAQVEAIVALLNSFGAEAGVVSNVRAALSGKSSCLQLSYALSAGARDADTSGDVSKLQEYLAQDSSIYPGGLVTGYFGPATLAAVQRFQASHGIVSSGSPSTTGYGYVGTKTRAALACSVAPEAHTLGTPTVTLTASPTSVIEGQGVSLTFSSTNASSCSGNGITEGQTSGSVIVYPSQTTTYTITCYPKGTTGSPATTSATVTILTSSPIISAIDFDRNQKTITLYGRNLDRLSAVVYQIGTAQPVTLVYRYSNTGLQAVFRMDDTLASTTLSGDIKFTTQAHGETSNIFTYRLP